MDGFIKTIVDLLGGVPIRESILTLSMGLCTKPSRPTAPVRCLRCLVCVNDLLHFYAVAAHTIANGF